MKLVLFCYVTGLTKKSNEIEEIGKEKRCQADVALPSSKRSILSSAASIDSIGNLRHGYIASIIVVAIRLRRYTYLHQTSSSTDVLASQIFFEPSGRARILLRSS